MGNEQSQSNPHTNRRAESQTLHDEEETDDQALQDVKEIDGQDIHGAVLRGSSAFLVYDINLANSRLTKYATRSVIGYFTCKRCRPSDPWVWKSEDVCTELWYAPVSGRYRTLLHSQKCKKCDAFVEPQADLEDYVRKLTSAFQSWKNERPPEYAHQENEIWTDPHDPARCHGCLQGVCPKGYKTVKGSKKDKTVKDAKKDMAF